MGKKIDCSFCMKNKSKVTLLKCDLNHYHNCCNECFEKIKGIRIPEEIDFYDQEKFYAITKTLRNLGYFENKFIKLNDLFIETNNITPIGIEKFNKMIEILKRHGELFEPKRGTIHKI